MLPSLKNVRNTLFFRSLAVDLYKTVRFAPEITTKKKNNLIVNLTHLKLYKTLAIKQQVQWNSIRFYICNFKKSSFFFILPKALLF